MPDVASYTEFLADTKIMKGLIVADKGFPKSVAYEHVAKHADLHYMNLLERGSKLADRYRMLDVTRILPGYEGIACKKDLDLNSGSITVLAANNGVKGNNSVQVKGGSLSVSAWGDGIKATALDKEGKGYVEISGGTVTVESWSDGVQAATELRITGGSLSVTARGDGVENSSKALKAGSLILLSDGLVSLNSQEDALRCSEGSVSITGGTLDILCLSDGIQAGEKDSGLGDVTVSGGDLRISAGNRAIKAQGSFSVTGGSIRALCGSEKQNPATGSPCLLCLISGAQGDSLQIGDLESIQARQDYTCLLLVREGLNAGAQITVSNGSGSITATVK